MNMQVAPYSDEKDCSEPLHRVGGTSGRLLTGGGAEINWASFDWRLEELTYHI
jgi:hypothetical protein